MNIKDKVIFLDIDGCIATHKEYSTKKTSKRYLHDFQVYPFNEKCVEILNKILDETNAEIVLSSNWVLYFSLDQMQEIFKINGINKLPYDFVEQIALKLSTSDEVNRGYSIDNYISQHNHQFRNYVIIDDLNIKQYGYFKTMSIDFDKFVHCSRGDFEGIKQTGIKEKIIKILNQ